MALSIRKQSVELKARTLADRRGMTMTGVIEQALDNELLRDDEAKEERRRRAWAVVREVQDAVAAMPDNGLTEDQIMGWDENGLPT